LSDVVRVGLIGYGFSGRTFHAPVLTCVPGLELRSVVERKGAASRERYPWVQVVRDARSLYEDEAIDLIVVATPSTDHVSFARDALLAGKHVVVEKPFTTTSSEADELIRLARQTGKTISVFQNRRWDGDFLTVQDVCRQGLLGTLKDVEFRWDRYSPQANPAKAEGSVPGTGVLYDLGVHLLDQALCLFGVPAAVSADIRTMREGAGSADYFEMTLLYKDGLRVRLTATYLAREPGPRYALHGTAGSFVKYGVDVQEEKLANGGTPAERGWGTEPADMWGKLNASLGDLHFVGNVETIPGAYQAYYRNVYEAITGQAELAVTAEQARTAIRLIELGYRSHAEGRRIEVT